MEIEEGSPLLPKKGSHKEFDIGSSTHSASLNFLISTQTTEQIEASLENANPFLKRRMNAFRSEDKISILQIPAGGKSISRSLTLWELYGEVLLDIQKFDLGPEDETVEHEKSPAFKPKSRPRSKSCATVDFRIRDLRWLEAYFSEQELTILVRRHLTIIVLDPIRALVMANKLILIIPPGADSLLSILDKYMSAWAPEVMVGEAVVSIPFELHAYEAILTAVKVLQTKRLEHIQEAAEDILSLMQKGSLLPLKLQEDMRELKNTTSQMALNVANYLKALDKLIMSDDDMALMNLTALKANPQLYRTPLSKAILSEHEVEELLQTYVMDYTSIASSLEVLRNQIQNAEDLVLLRLDTSRNELLIANTAFALGAFCVGIGGYLAGVFGMNLDNVVSIEEVHGLFAMVLIGSILLMLAIFGAIYGYLSHAGVIPSKTKTTGTGQTTAKSV